MAKAGSTHGSRIRALLASAVGNVAVIAPFVKVDALRSLLKARSPGLHVRCVTRWLPREVAAGISDPEILDLLEERGDFRLSLVDRLHAKLYIAGNRCLAGSSNVTFAGLGEGGDDSNIEVLVETSTNDPAVVSTLEEISKAERQATRAMAQTARRLADSLSDSATGSGDLDAPWFPCSRRPEFAYHFYARPPSGYVGIADRVLLADVAGSNLPPGLVEDGFRATIRSLLAAIPIGEILLSSTEDLTLTRADAQTYLDRMAGDRFSANDLWIAFCQLDGVFLPRSGHTTRNRRSRAPTPQSARTHLVTQEHPCPGRPQLSLRMISIQMRGAVGTGHPPEVIDCAVGEQHLGDRALPRTSSGLD